MKQKKRENVPSSLLILRHVFFIRRRSRHHLFSLASAFAAFLFLFLAAVSLFSAPPPIILHHHNSPSEGGSSLSERHLWSSRHSSLYYGCSNATNTFPTAAMKTHPNRYLLIATSGGLNQQRTGITDAVVAAYILNATLVVPKMDKKSFWKDASDFAEIFDVDWFISFLSRDVEIIKQLPSKGGKVLIPHSMRVPRKCTPSCYENRVLPVLVKKHAVQLGKFDYRLSNKLDSHLQKLRCRVNYHALRFTDPVLELGKKLVERMRRKSEHFIALHLRFEPDMLAFSGCYYGGGDKERAELGAIRARWKSLHAKDPEKERRHGRCPLTPEEVGLMLRALGYGSDVHVYVASGAIYGGEEALAPLKSLFPNLQSKETLASKEELGPVLSFSSRMAALDFIVCDESDVFVTNNNGNMAKMLAGRRRYFGHKPTIRPNAKKLHKLFMNRRNTSWEGFASEVQTHQIGFMGAPNEMKPGWGEFHENPWSCICEDSEAKAKGGPENQIGEEYTNSEENNEMGENGDDHHKMEDDGEQDLAETGYLENVNGVQGKVRGNAILMENTEELNVEQSEMEELLWELAK
ncbi:hypothetical protein K2173_010561 [Erythroxylum novogranatense]|uniref:O-fucosyltransferase family protein n=1 Tax=Erythroxylum novogranatense TaxID=1862640 RepID=A0AAV8TFQ4_9ROSI|nr:hypothetical protein K2173_010561 [Erythroxylum novogranatense]